jgi:hypothetical protein
VPVELEVRHLCRDRSTARALIAVSLNPNNRWGRLARRAR